MAPTQRIHPFAGLAALVGALGLSALAAGRVEQPQIESSAAAAERLPEDAGVPQPVHPPESAAARALREGRPLDVNTASVDDLQLLPGIGPALAQRIAGHRAEHGPFVRPEDLENVRGIGPRTVEALRPLVRAGDVDAGSR